MLRKRHVAFLVLAPLVLASCGGGGDSTGGETAGNDGDSYNLRFASYNVPTAAESVTSQAWAEEVEEATDGQVTIEFFYQEGLLSGVDTLTGVADGRADMGYIAGAYYPAELPLSNVAGVPFVTEDAVAQGRTFIELYDTNEDLRAEWEAQGVHVVTWAPVPANIVAMKEPVQSLADLEGQGIRGYGYVSEALEIAGANAIGMSQGEVYEALQRGVLDGTSGASLDIAVDRDYQEVAPHFVDINFGNYAVTANIIRLELWESMPEDMRATITEISEGYLEDYLEQLAELEVAACDKLLEAGGDVTILDESDTAGWRDEAGPTIQQIWVEDVQSSNPDADPEAFYEEYTSTLAEYEAESDYESAMRRCAERQ